MTRTFVELGDGRLVYAPELCEDSFRHTIMESFSGEMKQYAATANARRGVEFNQAVADVLSAQGWKVRVEVAMTELEAGFSPHTRILLFSDAADAGVIAAESGFEIIAKPVDPGEIIAKLRAMCFPPATVR